MGLLSPLLLPWPLVADGAAKETDSTARNSLRDSLTRLQKQRESLHRLPTGERDIFSFSALRLFTADVTGPSELLESAPLCLPVRFGFSNLMNRFLVYGNVAPIAPVFTDGHLLFSTFDPLKGTDDVFTTEFSSMTLFPNNVCRYIAYPLNAAVPEGCFFWENGVFGENLFNVRFMRPFSERLTVNAFSGFRHFANTRFDHEGNGVYSFYQSLVSDTSVLANAGYSPLTNEYAAGAKARWAGSGGNDLRLGIKYADCSNEFALDRPMTANWPSWATLNQYRMTIDAAGSGNRVGALIVDVQGRFENDALVRFAPDSGQGSSVRKDGANQSMAFAIQGSVRAWRDDTVSVSYRAQRTVRTPFTLPESRSIEQAPGVSVTQPFRAGPFRGSCMAAAGYSIFSLDDSLTYSPTFSASMTVSYGGQRARLYGKRDILPYFVPYDSALFLTAPLLDVFRIGGGELSLTRGAMAWLLGCQVIEGVSRVSVMHAWPEGAPPYEQPRLVIYAEPSYGPWWGFTFSSRLFLADRAPFVKAQGVCAYTVHPAGTGQHIDLRLSLDYWSKRDSIVFAGISDWGRAVYDLNCQIAAHVGAFRFFAKVGNLLNRKFAYVPGYFSPGVTFRWGINWYLQK